MIRQPGQVIGELLRQQAGLMAEKKQLRTALGLGAFTEGHCAQVLHVGSFAAEGPAIAAWTPS